MSSTACRSLICSEHAPTARPETTPARSPIEYAVLPGYVAVFCLTGDRIAATRVRIDRRELEMRIDALDSAIRRRAPLDEVRSASAALYNVLLKPMRSQLGGVGELVIVPDRQLFAVPFAALYDAKNSRYLVEDFAIRFAPAVSSTTSTTTTLLAPALVVADPPTSKPRLREGRCGKSTTISPQRSFSDFTRTCAPRPRLPAPSAIRSGQCCTPPSRA